MLAINASAIAMPARIFALVEIAPWSCQSLIGGLSVGWVMIQLCRRVELLPKQNAASSKNGVVGKSGRGIPIKPRASAISPAKSQSILVVRFLPRKFIALSVPECTGLLNG